MRRDLAAGHVAARGPNTGLNGFPIPRPSRQPQEDSGTPAAAEAVGAAVRLDPVTLWSLPEL